MSKNLIYTVAVNHETSQFKNTDYSQYCLMSWKKWCKKRNIDFLVIDKHNPRYKFPVWNKDTIFEIVSDTYDKIGYVDSDTMVHWDAPNPFDLYDDEWCWTKDISNLRWISNSIDYFQKFYPNKSLDIYDYYNSGISFCSVYYLVNWLDPFDIFCVSKYSCLIIWIVYPTLFSFSPTPMFHMPICNTINDINSWNPH